MKSKNEPSKATGEVERSAAGLLAYWAPPILVGLLVGFAVVFLIRQGGIGRSEVDAIVARWDYGAAEENTRLAEEIQSLGPDARQDLIDAFHDVEDDLMDLKVWAATRLLKEPFFDRKYLAGVARTGKQADRRAAAVALALHLKEEADPDVVLPGILDWLRDLSRDDQSEAIAALARLGPLTSDRRDAARDALLALARPRPPVTDDADLDFVPEVREDAVGIGLGPLLPDPEIEELLHATMADDDDYFAPRIASIRALSENNIFRSREPWAAAAKSTEDVVRQCVADNLFRATDPAFADVLRPMHEDPHAYVRSASIETQMRRGQPTMLPVIDQLLEDHDVWVRFDAINACAAFRDQPGAPARNGQILRIFAESDEDTDVAISALALHTITKKAFGFREADLHHYTEEVEEAALDAFMKDPEGRANAVEKYREAFGGTAVWTDADRKATLEKLAKHADPDNRKRAERLLAAIAESE